MVHMVDREGQTLIHRAAYENSFGISEYLISYLRDRLHESLILQLQQINQNEKISKAQEQQIYQQVQKQVAEWINTPSKTDQGFYPLHYASFHGNIKMIKLLVKHGANIKAKNKMGINMMHVAAQGDQAYSLTYFYKQGLGVNSVDDEGSTPLHWACFAGSDTASYYLQSWNCHVNARDAVGNTPLHLAVKSAAHFPNTRAIKELLIKGGSRTIETHNGSTPYDLIEPSADDDNLDEELKTLLGK